MQSVGSNKQRVGLAMKIWIFLAGAIQTVVKHGTDVHIAIQTVIQTVVKHGTDIQTMRRVKVIKFKTFNTQQSVRLYHVSQRSV